MYKAYGSLSCLWANYHQYGSQSKLQTNTAAYIIGFSDKSISTKSSLVLSSVVESGLQLHNVVRRTNIHELDVFHMCHEVESNS